MLMPCAEYHCGANANGMCWAGGCTSVKFTYRISTSNNYTCVDTIQYGGNIKLDTDKVEEVFRDYMNRKHGNYYRHLPHIKKVIFNNPATIVLWDDGSKTVVKKSEKDAWDPEKGLAMAIVKKLFTRNQFLKMIPKEVWEATDSEVQDTVSDLNALLKAASEGKVDNTR